MCEIGEARPRGERSGSGGRRLCCGWWWCRCCCCRVQSCELVVESSTHSHPVCVCECGARLCRLPRSHYGPVYTPTDMPPPPPSRLTACLIDQRTHPHPHAGTRTHAHTPRGEPSKPEGDGLRGVPDAQSGDTACMVSSFRSVYRRPGVGSISARRFYCIALGRPARLDSGLYYAPRQHHPTHRVSLPALTRYSLPAASGDAPARGLWSSVSPPKCPLRLPSPSPTSPTARGTHSRLCFSFFIFPSTSTGDHRSSTALA